jgi:hypothetical protein
MMGHEMRLTLLLLRWTLLMLLPAAPSLGADAADDEPKGGAEM